MQKRIFLLLLICTPILLSAQNFTEGFDTVSNIYLNGWVQKNNSSPMGSGTWEQDFGNFTAHSGSSNSSVVVGYTSITDGQSGDISNWLISPTITFDPGDSIIFWTISFQNTTYPDRLEVRLNRSNTTNVGSSTTDVGDFDTTLLVINPNLEQILNGYPMVWTRFGIRIDGIGPATPCRIGLRYHVTDGGQAGSNSSTIGIDDFEYKSIYTSVENENPLTAYVTLVNSQLIIEVPEAVSDFETELVDISGKKLISGKYNKTAILDMQEYSSGVYLIRITYKGKYLIKKISF